jgi:hypothetical protein
MIVVQGIVFLAWAFVAFRFLFRLRAHAVAASGRTFPPVAAQLDAFAAGARDPAFAADRRRLVLLTLAVLTLSVLSAL